MKKIYSVVLSVLVFVSLFSLCAYAQNALITIESNSSSAAVGDELTVGLVLAENSNIGGVELDLTFDTACYEYVAGSASVDESVFTLAQFNDSKSGKITYVGVTADSVNKSGVLMTAKFKVLKTGGEFGINVEEAVDGNDADMAVNIQNSANKLSVSNSGSVISQVDSTTAVAQANSAVGNKLELGSGSQGDAADGVITGESGENVTLAGGIANGELTTLLTDSAKEKNKDNVSTGIVVAIAVVAVIIAAAVAAVLYKKKSKKEDK